MLTPAFEHAEYIVVREVTFLAPSDAKLPERHTEQCKSSKDEVKFGRRRTASYKDMPGWSWRLTKTSNIKAFPCFSSHSGTPSTLLCAKITVLAPPDTKLIKQTVRKEAGEIS